MNYISVCSGIEAATVAWHDLGFNPVGFSEIEPFPCAVLAHHYPHVPNFGDMTKFQDWNTNDTVNLIVGGTPCQSFSVAGLREGLSDPRGNLCLTFLAILEKFKPRWFIWENVPGVLSSGKGNDFARFLSAANEIGYSCAWRIFDAQFFGVPQRRRRVFVVGYFGDWQYPAAVLFEQEGMRGDIEAGRGQGQKTAYHIERGSGRVMQSVSYTLTAKAQRLEPTQESFVCFQSNAASRRLMPVERERLQGFPDHYTQIPYRGKSAENCPDGPRYKAIGNSMAVPVMRWIGERIKMVDSLKL